jgi:hypothetical protein
MVPRKDAERREGLLPLALTAAEAAVRRAGRSEHHCRSGRSGALMLWLHVCVLLTVGAAAHPAAWQLCALAVSQRRLQARLLQPAALNAAAGVQAVTCASDLVLAVGSVDIVAPAAKALLTSLVKVKSVASLPGSFIHTALLVSPRRLLQHPSCLGSQCCTPHARENSCGCSAEPACDAHVNMRQDALKAPCPDQSSLSAIAWAAGRALPAELLPYAAAQLLPPSIRSPESVRALDVHPEYKLDMSEILSAALVSMRLFIVRPLEHPSVRLVGWNAWTLSLRLRRAPAAGWWRTMSRRSARRWCWRARAWCRLSRRRWTSWPSSVRACWLCPAR